MKDVKAYGQRILRWLGWLRPVELLYTTSTGGILAGNPVTFMTVAAGNLNFKTTIEVPAGRGDVQGWGLTVAGEAGILDSEWIQANATIKPSGIESVETTNLFRWTKEYRYERRTFIPQWIAEKSTITVEISNPGTKEIYVCLDLYWYDVLMNMNLVPTPPTPARPPQAD